MCYKLRYCAIRIDPCMQELVNGMNQSECIRTLSSCCGHGRYPPTIVYRYKHDLKNIVSIKIMDKNKQFITFIKINKKKGNRYYKKDKKGYYYIPEVKEYIKLQTKFAKKQISIFKY